MNNNSCCRSIWRDERVDRDPSSKSLIPWSRPWGAVLLRWVCRPPSRRRGKDSGCDPGRQEGGGTAPICFVKKILAGFWMSGGSSENFGCKISKKDINMRIFFHHAHFSESNMLLLKILHWMVRNKRKICSKLFSHWSLRNGAFLSFDLC